MADINFLMTPRKEVPDLEERDPYDQNTHLTVIFEDIVGEPKEIHTYDLVWSNAFRCFDFCQILTYSVTTAFCSLPFIALDACLFANAFFLNVWCGSPCAKAMSIVLLLPKTFYLQFIDCCVRPCVLSSSRMFKAFTDR